MGYAMLFDVSSVNYDKGDFGKIVFLLKQIDLIRILGRGRRWWNGKSGTVALLFRSAI